MKRFLSLLLVIGLLTGCQAVKVNSSPSNEVKNNLRVTFLNVGQGDAILIQTPDNQKYLVDGGPDNTILNKLGEQLSFWDKSLAGIILTHPHADHVGGLPAVLARYSVAQLWLYPAVHTAPDYLAFLAAAKEKKINTAAIFAGQNLALGGGVNLQILWPPADNKDNPAWSKFSDLNSQSVVGRLTFGQTAILLMGDAPQEVEQELLKATTTDLTARVLKVGHHGSKYSSSPEFLAAVKPDWAVISVGANNSFGHPHFRTLYNLQQVSAKILRTDQAGDIEIVSDGQKVWSN
ncbi:MAG: ComEC/Rec2 family competence protein [Candidatus Buchananbacteria bacterium]